MFFRSVDVLFFLELIQDNKDKLLVKVHVLLLGIKKDVTKTILTLFFLWDALQFSRVCVYGFLLHSLFLL